MSWGSWLVREVPNPQTVFFAIWSPIRVDAHVAPAIDSFGLITSDKEDRNDKARIWQREVCCAP